IPSGKDQGGLSRGGRFARFGGCSSRSAGWRTSCEQANSGGDSREAQKFTPCYQVLATRHFLISFRKYSGWMTHRLLGTTVDYVQGRRLQGWDESFAVIT